MFSLCIKSLLKFYKYGSKWPFYKKKKKIEGIKLTFWNYMNKNEYYTITRTKMN